MLRCLDREPCLTFTELVTVPVRKRGPTKKRAKPPSYLLTSKKHFEYISKRKQSKKSKNGEKKTKKKDTAKPGSSKEGDDVCRVCKFRYGAAEDPKKTEEWMKCENCDGWFHLTCAEMNGIFDDSSFICRDCLLEE